MYAQINIDFSKIGTQNMNSEEEDAILKLYKENNTPLTFTNRIIYNIQTTNEVPVHGKSYRYPYIHKTNQENAEL